MLRSLATMAFAVSLSISVTAQPAAAAVSVRTELPPSIDQCFKRSLAGIFDAARTTDRALFEYFLANINVDQFGRYNFKRAWLDWGDNAEIKRLALYEYFSLMAKKRREHGGGTAGVEARLADHPAVRGDNVHHIIARVGFNDGSSASIVVFSAGCKAFGFMYGGTDLRGLVDVNLIEKMYRDGARAPS
ncbi:hypothetical protein P1J78_12465 [Psychromarinibacter sp. C21-152]|uniref:SnoaL-like domain-containing protein n=1 Tax=Psychromarinibacter sediminicola TaxID=3033385 RepID=A0AAE3T8L5_9RHOB|nr:hypothetical protein [Psychromarinibacter sediminicola]MDF0601550.1 hypothetical protein [Psychromarinibacter sediminicola]